MTWIGLALGLLLVATAFAYLRAALTDELRPAPDLAAPDVVGRTVILCHAGRDNSDGWARARSVRVAQEAGNIGVESYAQFRRLPRLNLVYILLRLSRSWPVAAVISLLHGLPMPPLVRSRERQVPTWAFVEVFGFLDETAAGKFAASSDWTQGCDAVVMSATRKIVDGSGTQPKVSVLFFLKARDFLGRDAMLDYWLDPHRARVVRRQPVLAFTAYEQLAAPKGAEEAAWDGVARLDYASQSILRGGIINLRVQAANMNLVWDETRFLDFRESHLFFGEALDCLDRPAP